jgi:hypothetical protein
LEFERHAYDGYMINNIFYFLSLSLFLSVLVKSDESVGELSLSLFKNRFLDTISSGKFNPRFFALTNDNNVTKSGSEGVSLGILDMDDIKRTLVLLNVLDDSDSSNVVSVLDEADITRFEMSESLNFSSCNIVLKSITNLDFGVRESNSSGIVSNNVRDLVGTDGLGGNL